MLKCKEGGDGCEDETELFGQLDLWMKNQVNSIAIVNSCLVCPFTISFSSFYLK